MPLEVTVPPVLPDQLNPLWPLASDVKSEGDDHIRNTKQALVNFYEIMNLDELPPGSIPVYIGGKFYASGLAFDQGQAALLRPFVAPMFIQGLGLNPTKYQLIGVEMADTEVKRPESPTADALTEIVVQPDDTTTNVSPLLWTFVQPSAAWVKAIIVRSTTAVVHVRVTLRRNNASGDLIYQTASDAELIAGGGVALSASGDSTFLFPQKLEIFAGATIHVTVDRYDTTGKVFTTDGITLKGQTISGQFVPYQRSQRQALVRRPVVMRRDLPVRTYQMNNTDVALSSTLAVLGTFTFQHNSETTAYGVEVAASINNIPNSTLTLNVFVNNVLVDTGSGYTARINNANAGLSYSVPCFFPYTFAVNTLYTIRIEAALGAGTATKKSVRMSINRTDSGDVWA